MVTLRQKTAAEVRNQQKSEREREREREREMKRERGREGNELQPKMRDRDWNIFHDWIRHCNFYFSNLVDK